MSFLRTSAAAMGEVVGVLRTGGKFILYQPDLESAHHNGAIFCAEMGFIVSGSKP